jgi:UDP-glucose 4-epimerase
MLASLVPGVSGRVFNVACGAATTLLQVLDHVAGALAVSITPRFEPGRASDVKHSIADVSQARAHLGYTGSVSMAEGLSRTIKWFQEQRRGTPS